MKGTIKLDSNVLTVTFPNKTPNHIHQRLLELGFKSSKLRKRYIQAKGLTESQFDYLEGLVGHTGLGMAYIPATEKGFILDTVVPDSMGYEMHIAIRKVKEKIGMPLFQYVATKLDYTDEQLVKSLAAEQVDSVALAIFNIEEKEQGIIIGDQTGIGKGRQAAAMIRYGIKNGMKPIFLSEKPNLFSDIYRDMVDILSEEYVPFIVNARESKTHIKDKNGTTIYQAPVKADQDKILKSQKLGKEYDYVCATYSQFNQPKKKPLKPGFLAAMAKGNLIILDEAHNSSGSSQTGEFMRSVLWQTKGVVFLSATYAKRPDNMPIYAMKTAIREASLTNEGLIDAILNGGVALQEVLSSQLVLEGQLIRRERSFEGVEVNYMNLDSLSKEHERMADKVTDIIRDIIEFQELHITPIISEMDSIAAATGAEIEARKGTKRAGVDNMPYFSKVFNIINQMLFAIKAESVANHAIKMMKQGYKPIVAFSSTMGSFLEDMGGVNDTINADFSTVLEKGLNSVLRYTERDIDGSTIKHELDIASLDADAQSDYYTILDKIENAATGILISPIDLIVQKIEQAGFTVGEVTGRKLALRYSKHTLGNVDTIASTALIEKRKKESTNDLFREFNNNELDALLINQSGSTGASAHAVPTDKVPESEVKKRVMIILQAELDINTEIQKRGRINRTGQIYKPRYDYLISTIPAEQRLMMMLQKKLKSLDANTTSNQKSSEKQLKTDDFLNKYGDKVVKLYLIENPKLNLALGNPTRSSKDENSIDEDFALFVSGRVAILPVKEQRKFYKDVLERYHDYVEYLIQSGEYDLELETLNLQAETKERKITKAGQGGESSFGQDTYLEKCECNVLRKPFKKMELEKQIKDALNGQTADEIKSNIIAHLNQVSSSILEKELMAIEDKYDRAIENITNEAKYKKADNQSQYLAEREKELNKARTLDQQQKSRELNNRKSHMLNFIRFFKIGQGLQVPAIGFDAMGESVKGISLGLHIDKKRANPFAPSAVKVKIAIADSRKMLALPLSGDTGREAERILSRSYRLTTIDSELFVENWNDHIKAYDANRHTRYIFTGNLLQAATENGKLVSFTTKSGDTRKGVLMPEGWSPDQKGNTNNAYVMVSIKDAIPYIKSLRNGASVQSENGIGFFRRADGYKVIIPKKTHFQSIFKDEELYSQVDGNVGFTLVSGNMVGEVSDSNAVKFLTILSEKHRISVKVGRNIFDQFIEPNRENSVDELDELTVKAKKQLQKDRKEFEQKLRMQNSKKPKKNDSARKIKLLKLRAKAIIIKQKQAA
ncbi:strawberry notch C-terminal domain-containing protein [Saccharicrinis sp. GN24d3]|uniref:strawberry notch C-terminal domain-containing protein n=1 Tax=Saccharicrinis sp. GN24d3 TaxID=3458416 RepID=UPI00403658CC